MLKGKCYILPIILSKMIWKIISSLDQGFCTSVYISKECLHNCKLVVPDQNDHPLIKISVSTEIFWEISALIWEEKENLTTMYDFSGFAIPLRMRYSKKFKHYHVFWKSLNFLWPAIRIIKVGGVLNRSEHFF